MIGFKEAEPNRHSTTTERILNVFGLTLEKPPDLLQHKSRFEVGDRVLIITEMNSYPPMPHTTELGIVIEAVPQNNAYKIETDDGSVLWSRSEYIQMA